jgi:hypothetical protein
MNFNELIIKKIPLFFYFTLKTKLKIMSHETFLSRKIIIVVNDEAFI